MLYEEFVEGTGCRDTAYNMKVYKDLEIMYMNSDLTKQDIYEYGKKLVNNDLTDKQVAWNAEMDRQIEELKARIEELKDNIARYEANYRYYKEMCWDDLAKDWKKWKKEETEEIRRLRNKIREIKDCKYV